MLKILLMLILYPVAIILVALLFFLLCATGLAWLIVVAVGIWLVFL